MLIDFILGIINIYYGDIYNCIINIDNVKMLDILKWFCDNWEE